MIYNIADVLIKIDDRLNVFEGTKDTFSASSGNKSDAVCKVMPLFSENLRYGVWFDSLEGFDFSMKTGSSVIVCDKSWTNAAICGEHSADNDSLLLMFLYSYLVTRGALLFHSSLVDYNGRGIMFVGPSGIGKTTQAELWNKYQNADILNGDMVLIRKKGDGFFGYGTPWHGSSPYFQNKKVKIKAVVALSQSEKNSLKKLSDFELLESVSDQVFFPYWYSQAIDSCLSSLDSFLTSVPVYHMSCRADRDSVTLLKNELNL